MGSPCVDDGEKTAVLVYWAVWMPMVHVESKRQEPQLGPPTPAHAAAGVHRLLSLAPSPVSSRLGCMLALVYGLS